MIVKHKADLMGTSSSAGGDGWASTRMLVRSDGVGFSLNDTEVAAGTEMELHYANHIEANYCISGKGTLTDLETGETFPIEPGMMYCLDKHDRHKMSAHADEALRFICVFTPALVGDEAHNQTGGYDA